MFANFNSCAKGQIRFASRNKRNSWKNSIAYPDARVHDDQPWHDRHIQGICRNKKSTTNGITVSIDKLVS